MAACARVRAPTARHCGGEDGSYSRAMHAGPAGPVALLRPRADRSTGRAVRMLGAADMLAAACANCASADEPPRARARAQIFEPHGEVEEVFLMRGGSRSGMYALGAAAAQPQARRAHPGCVSRARGRANPMARAARARAGRVALSAMRATRTPTPRSWRSMASSCRVEPRSRSLCASPTRRAADEAGERGRGVAAPSAPQARGNHQA